MDLVVKHAWNIDRSVASTSSSGGLTAVYLPISVQYTMLSVAFSTLATTQSLSYQSALESSGPWFIEASTQLSTAVSTRMVMRVAGPVGSWVRPYFHTASTGAYDVLLLGVG